MSRSIRKGKITIDGEVIWTSDAEIIVGPATETILDIDFKEVSNETVTGIFLPYRATENGK